MTASKLLLIVSTLIMTFITHVANISNQFVPFQDSKIPGLQDSKFLGECSIVTVNDFDLPDSKKVSHML
jgi:hypothetical protein